MISCNFHSVVFFVCVCVFLVELMEPRLALNYLCSKMGLDLLIILLPDAQATGVHHQPPHPSCSFEKFLLNPVAYLLIGFSEGKGGFLE